MIQRSPDIFAGFRWIEESQSVLVVDVVDGVRDEALQTVVFDPLRAILRLKMLLVLIVSDKVGRYEHNLTD